MAMSFMIRKASSHAVVPLAVRAVASSYPGIILTNHAFIKAEEHKNFSTVPAPNSEIKIVDKKLNKVLRSELKLAEQLPSEKRVMPPTPANFPFNIEDNPGENVFTLKREIGSEKIEIEVDMPCICQFPKEPKEEISTSTDSSDDDSDDDEVLKNDESKTNDNDNDNDNDNECKKCFTLTIKVSKENGNTLTFGVRAYEHWNFIDTITVVDEAESEDKEDHKYLRPLFVEELGFEVQNGLRKFLEIRGIKEIDYGFLQKYIISKHKRDQLLMLGKVKKFVKE